MSCLQARIRSTHRAWLLSGSKPPSTTCGHTKAKSPGQVEKPVSGELPLGCHPSSDGSHEIKATAAMCAQFVGSSQFEFARGLAVQSDSEDSPDHVHKAFKFREQVVKYNMNFVEK